MAEALGLFYRLLADDLRDPTILRQNSSDEVALFLRLLLSRKVRLPRKLRLAAEDLLSRVPRAFDALHGSSIARAKDILKNAESEQALLEASRLLGTVACSGPHKKAYARARVDLVRQMIPYLLQSIADRDGPAFHRQHGALYLVWISEHCADELRAILTPVAISLQQAIRRDLKAGPQGIQKLGSDIGHGLRYNPQLTGPDGERTRELVDELRCEMAKSDMLTFVASLPETFNPMERITGVHIGRQEARQAVQTYYRAMAEVRNPGRFKPSFEREYGPTPAQQRSACVLMARDMSG